MSLDTYDNLKSEIAGWLKRDDLTAYIPTFISLAESRHKREVRLRQMISREAITVDARQISLPTGFLQPITLRLLTNPVTPLRYISYHEMNRVRSETSGQPTYYTSGNEFEFDVAPDSSYSGEIVFYKAETALSDSNASNNILTEAPGCYLYGALLAAEPFLQNDERLATWGALYAAEIQGLKELLRGSQRGSPQSARVAGDTP